MRSGNPSGSAGARATPEALPPLLPERAFVVQFRAGAGIEPERFAGRVEHIVSAQATQFHSLEELQAFMARVLSEVEAKGGD
jgi:hypothetical protein